MNPKKGYGENETGVFKREILNGNLQRERLKGGGFLSLKREQLLCF